MLRPDIVRLKDMLDAALLVQDFTSRCDFDQFSNEPMRLHATVRQLEVLGEAAKSISQALRGKYHTVPLSDIAKTRDKMIHHYFSVDQKIVWSIARRDIPSLIVTLEEIIRKEGDEP